MKKDAARRGGDELGLVPVRRALVSMSDKAGLVELGQALASWKVEIVSTGGTAAALRKAGLKVIDVAKVTGLPEILDGRVKTLHPAIHGGLLARRERSEHMTALRRRGFLPIDLVVVTLYPFEATAADPSASEADAVEQVDIGGPAMIRSASKNFESVAVVADVGRVSALVRELREHRGATTREFRRAAAGEAFARTATYDAAIARFFQGETTPFPRTLLLRADKASDLRYGENPHQRGALYRFTGELGGIANATQLAGKELSYNNLLDADAAYRAALEFAKPACVIVKHLTPCAVATADSPEAAWRRAFAADPVSAFGGIVAFNRPLTAAVAAASRDVFLEVVLAPDVDRRAVEGFAARKNLRVLAVGAAPFEMSREIRAISGGFVAQDPDLGVDDLSKALTVTKRKATPKEWDDLVFAWKVAKHVRSNAIVIAAAGATVGVGGGQTSRVTAVAQAVSAAGAKTKGAVLASDAFFPFPDGVEAAARAGVSAVIQPGGSLKDAEVIAAADRSRMAMVFTKVRHFRH